MRFTYHRHTERIKYAFNFAQKILSKYVYFNIIMLGF